MKKSFKLSWQIRSITEAASRSSGPSEYREPVKKHKIASNMDGVFASVFTTVGAGKMSTSQLLFPVNLIQRHQKEEKESKDWTC